MKLLTVFNDYVTDQDKGERAAFEAAMIEKIQKDGMKMSDLIYEIFICQKVCSLLANEVTELKAKICQPKKK